MQTKKIFPLSSKIIAKIAAGEVIERPVYAVKELIENAIDANADKIEIHVENAGLKKITVIDNGEGMGKEDLLESFKLHTTSKLLSEDDLSQISTLGFRGEALASIAAIADITLESKTKTDTTGTKIEIINGKIKNISPIGMPQGTKITVSHLFHLIPGRKKFLKSETTEFRHILDFVTKIALANLNINFILYHNKKLIFDLSKNLDLLERIKNLLGNSISNNLLKIRHQNNYISMTGFAGNPQSAITSSAKQYIFVNKRPVQDKLISQAVKNAFGNLIKNKTYPIFIIFISLPFEFVDVNVHPRKEEIKFNDSQMLYDAIYSSISKTLTENNLTYYIDENLGLGLADKVTNSFAGRLLKENQTPWDIRIRNEISKIEPVQFHNLYLLTPTKYGIAFIDQHAAHERILYEQFTDEFKKQKSEIGQFHLSKPQILELSFAEKELLEESSIMFEKLGFAIENFKNNTYLITAVPLIFKDRKPETIVNEILNDLSQNKSPKEIDLLSDKMLKFLACRAAVKAGESLTKKQAKDLVEKLEKTNNNVTCPHGRPTKIIIDLEQVHKMFKRK